MDKIQKFRCEKIIAEVEERKIETGVLPEKLKISFGIDYVRMKDKENFTISYSRGFLVTEMYESSIKDWRSHSLGD